MIKSRKPAHKLTIRTETVRQLDDQALRRVAGQAQAQPSDGWVCETLSHGLSCWGSCSTRMWC
jgi:hypothetical protein